MSDLKTCPCNLLQPHRCHDHAAEIAHLHAEVERLREERDNKEVQSVPSIVAAHQAVMRELAEAYDRRDSNRGAFSCVEPHDLRCPKSRADSPEKWKGKWQCECGRERLDAALAHPLVVAARKEKTDG